MAYHQKQRSWNPSKIEWDLTNGPLSKLRSSYKILRFVRGPWTVGPTVGDFLDGRLVLSDQPQLFLEELRNHQAG